MESFHEDMQEYRNQLEKGTINKAYQGLMKFIADLRMHLKSRHTDYFISGEINFGFMDWTYFSFTPKSLKDRELKIVILFEHRTFQFHAWLAGYNKQVQAKFWKLFKASGWDKYFVVPATKGVDSIVEYVLVDNPDFRDLDALTGQIEAGTLKFIADVESFLSGHQG